MYSININNLPNSLNKETFISEKIVNKNFDIEFIYGSNFKNTKILRHFMEVICLKLSLPNKEISKLILIVDELNNNAIEYWTDSAWENKLRIKTIKNKKNIDIIVEVEGNGRGISPKTALEMETLRAHQLRLWYWNHESIRWRGLFMIIVKSVDRLYFKDTSKWGLIVWIKKSIKL